MRTFDFIDPRVGLGEAQRVIAAALDDEGLVLLPADNGSHSGIRSALIDGVKRVFVPATRIGTKEA